MREKKLSKRKLQGAETKKRLYDIAVELFTKYNFKDISIEDITYAAGITKGTFYVHFESKDALIADIIAEQASKADGEYTNYIKTLPLDMSTPHMILALTEKIAHVLTDTIGYENMKKVYQLLLEGNNAEAVKGYSRELYTLYFDIIQKGIHRGELKSFFSPEALSRHFILAIRGVCYEWCIRYPDFNLREQALEHCQLFLEGIKAAE